MRSAWGKTALILGGITLVRYGLGLSLPPIPDETYYWTWSLAPDWCYWDQPAGIAWMHRGWGALFGAGPASLRALAAVLSLATSLLAYALFRRTLGEPSAFRGVLLLQTAPLFGVGSVLILHDNLLLFFGVLAWLLWAIALQDDRPRLWPLVGLAMAAALYAKFSAVILGAGLALGALLSPIGRRHLRTPWPYLGGALAAALFGPVIAWNARHQWVAYWAVRKLARDPKVVGWERLASCGDYLAGQLAVITPILAVFALIGAIAVWRRRPAETEARRLLAVPGLLIFGYFLLGAWRAKIQANWAALAWIGLFPLGIAWLSDAGRAGRRWAGPTLKVGVGLALAATLAVYLQALTGLVQHPKDPTNQAYGWRELAEDIQSRREEAGDPHLPVVTRPYQTAAMLTYYLPDHPLLYVADYAHRGSQFTLWQDYEKLAGRDALFIDSQEIPGKFARCFDQVEEKAGLFRARGGRPIEAYRGYLVRGFHLRGEETGYYDDPVAHQIWRIKRDRGKAEK